MKHALITALILACSMNALGQTKSYDAKASEANIVYRPLASDGTLKGTMSRWAKNAGLGISWRAPDYPLTTKALSLPAEASIVDGLRGLSRIYAKVATPFNVTVEQGILVVIPITTESAQVEAHAVKTAHVAPAETTPKTSVVSAAVPTVSASSSQNTSVMAPTRKAEDAAPKAMGTAATVVATESPKPASRDWKITAKDKSVRTLLERWAKEADYQLLWELPVDLELGATATLSGGFDEALSTVLASLSHSDYPVEALVYDNRVVRIVKHSPRNK